MKWLDDFFERSSRRAAQRVSRRSALVGIGRLLVGAAAERSQLLFFLSPTCPVCKKLLPILKSIAAAEAAWLDIVFASDGEAEEHAAFRRRAALTDFPYVLSAELGMAFRVGKLPYAVLLDEAGRVRAKGLVNSREQLESLFTAKEMNVASVQEFVTGPAGAGHGTGTGT